MEVWLYGPERCDWLWQVILFDGRNTYWTDEMIPSSGYSRRRLKSMGRFGVGRFYKIGDL
ncbi:MAG: hypothetical protein C4586_05795 [Anaerolineaceae bacterium]|nr:MAG: hypothetical protein C4586_05795 [Anaerolineaceae bacterium]